MTVIDNSEFVCLKKLPKAHNRGIVGVEVFRESGTNDLILATFAHDSLKFWSMSVFDDEVLLDQKQEIKKWLCGMQSYDISYRGKMIGIVGVESTLHQLFLEHDRTYSIQDVNVGYMQIWFVRISPDRSSFLTVNFSGSLQLIDLQGQVTLSVPFENAKQISSIIYGNTGKYIAFGTTLGWISVLDSGTFVSTHAFEGHAMKIRALSFTMDDKYILSGSDDKTIKLHDFAVPIGSKEQSIRMFCGHRGAVLQICLDPSSKGQRFASSATDMRIILWDLDSGNRLHIFSNCFEDVVTCLTFAVGRLLISATDSGTIFVNRVPLPENYEEEVLEEEITAHTPDELENESMQNENGHLTPPMEEDFMNTDEILQVENPSPLNNQENEIFDDAEQLDQDQLEFYPGNENEEFHQESPTENQDKEILTEDQDFHQEALKLNELKQEIENEVEDEEDFERHEIEMQLGID